IWVALVRNDMDIHSFTSTFKPIAEYLVSVGVTDPTLTGISNLPADKKAVVIHSLTSSPKLKRSLRPLLLFDEYLPDYELSKNAIEMEVDFQEDAAVLAETIARTMDHQSQESTDCRWFRLLPILLGGKIHVPPEMGGEFLSYPNVADMRHARPSIRAL